MSQTSLIITFVAFLKKAKDEIVENTGKILFFFVSLLPEALRIHLHILNYKLLHHIVQVD
jgi:hypothetical protein